MCDSQVHHAQINIGKTMEKIDKRKIEQHEKREERGKKDQILHTWKASYHPNIRDGIRCG